MTPELIYTVFAQTFGILGFILSIITFQQNEHKRIVTMQFLANTCFAIHFYMLGAFTGAVLNAIGIVRSFVYYHKDKKWAASNGWIVVFSLICVGAGVLTWQGPLSLVPMAGMILTSVAFGIENPKLVRRVAFPSSPLWLIYNVFNSSWGGVLTEVFNILSIIVGVLRFDRKKHDATEERQLG